MNMGQFDDNAGAQGAPRELPMSVLENPSSLGFLSPGLPVDNMYQENRGMSEIPTPSLEPINEGSGISSSIWLTFLISASCIRYEHVGYVSRDTPSHRPLVPSGTVGL